MSKYSLDFEDGEWVVLERYYSPKQVLVDRIVFKSTSEEEAECMLEEFRICEMAAEIDYYRDQVTEFDYV